MEYDLPSVAFRTAQRLRDRLAAEKHERGDYRFELALEALCEWSLVDPRDSWLAPVRAVWQRRGWHPGQRIPWRNQPFASHDDSLARATSDHRYVEAFLDETEAMVAEVPRDDQGRVTHGHLNPNIAEGRNPLLVDFMHEYAARLASAANLGGPASWYDEAAHQFMSYASVLVDPPTGLWHLGRDWGEEPGTLSPGAWSRGHGWLLRGMADTLRYLPLDHHRRPELVALFRATLDVLAARADDEGMWHVLLHRDVSESEAETSGTALIAYAIGRGIALGIFDRDRWLPVLDRAARGIFRRIDDAGIVYGACKGPGLLFDGSEADYLGQPLPVDDPHGLPTVLFGCLGARLAGEASMPDYTDI